MFNKKYTQWNYAKCKITYIKTLIKNNKCCCENNQNSIKIYIMFVSFKRDNKKLTQ